MIQPPQLAQSVDAPQVCWALSLSWSLGAMKQLRHYGDSLKLAAGAGVAGIVLALASSVPSNAQTTSAEIFDSRVELSNADGYQAEDDGVLNALPYSGPILPVANAAATGAPSISGTAAVGQTLSAVTTGIDDTDGLTSPTFTYQWQRLDADGTNPINIGGDASTYQLVAADARKRIRVTVHFSDDDGNSETATSANSDIVYAPTLNKPTVAGIPQEGETLTASTAGIEDLRGKPESFSYQWQRVDADGVSFPVDVGTGTSTYSLVLADVGKRIRVVVSFTESDGNIETRASDATWIVSRASNNRATGLPTIMGTAKVGEELSADPISISDSDGLASTAYTYQWQREDSGEATGWADIAGADDGTYTLRIADRYKRVRVTLSFTDDLGNHERRTSDAYPSDAAGVQPVDNVEADGNLTISGMAKVRGVLEVDPAGITDANGTDRATYTYQWQRGEDSATPGWTDIFGKNEATYTIVHEDQGRRLRVKVSFMDDDGYAEVIVSPAYPATGTINRQDNIEATGAPTINGTVKVGETLTVDMSSVMDDNGLGTFEYVWLQADGIEQTDIDAAIPIADATSDTYMPTRADEAKRLLVRVSFTDTDGYPESLTSAPTRVVQKRDNTPAAGAPTIVGLPRVGGVLLVDTSDISDGNGASAETFSYMWLRQSAANVWTTIVSATSNTYTLQPADFGMRIWVQVSFTDDDGHVETVDSDRTKPVSSASNVLATGTPEITGTATVGRTLVARPGDIADRNGLASTPYTYQWQRGEPGATVVWTDIAGATSVTYTLTAADQGMKIRTKIAFEDNDGNPEERTSEAYPAGNDSVQPATAGAAPPAAASILSVSSPIPAVEGGLGETSTLEFTVTLRPAAHDTVTVDYRYAGGTATTGANFDVTPPAPGTLTFLPGDTLKTVSATVHGDYIRESPETVMLALSNATGPAALDGTGAVATGFISNRPHSDVPAILSVVDGWINPGGEGQQTEVHFKLRNSRALFYAVTVEYLVAFSNPNSAAAQACVASPARSATIAIDSFEKSVQEIVGENCPIDSVEIRVMSVEAIGQPDTAIPDLRVEWQTAEYAVASVISVQSPKPLLRALSRFGRTIATGVVEGIWDRADTHRNGGKFTRIRVGGRTVDPQAFASGDANQAVREVAGVFGVEAVSPPDSPRDANLASIYSGDLDDYRAWSGAPDSDDLTSESSFALSLGDDVEDGVYTFWGEVGAVVYEDKSGIGTYVDGKSSNALIGFDYQFNDSLMLGLAAIRSSGDADYGSWGIGDGTLNGTVEAGMTGLAYYFHKIGPAGLSFWGSLGAGSGSFSPRNGRGSAETDLTMQMVALGARSDFWMPVFYADSFAVKGDYYAISTVADGTTSGLRLPELDTLSTRLRVATELHSERLRKPQQTESYFLEVGARLEGGQQASGVGVDVVANVNFEDVANGLTIHWSAGALILHTERVKELSTGLSAVYDPGIDNRGFRVSIEPAWNAPSSDVASAMRDQYEMDGLASLESGATLKGRLAYGADALNDLMLATVYGEAETGEKSRRLRMGAKLKGQEGMLKRVVFDLYGERKVAQSEHPDRRVMLEGSLKF